MIIFYCGIINLPFLLKEKSINQYFQNQQWKHQNKLRNLFRIKNKDTRTTLFKSLCCLYCQLWTDFTTTSSVPVLDFQQVNPNRVSIVVIDLMKCWFVQIKLAWNMIHNFKNSANTWWSFKIRFNRLKRQKRIKHAQGICLLQVKMEKRRHVQITKSTLKYVKTLR